MDWLKRARDGKMTQREAAERMGVSERWVRNCWGDEEAGRRRGGAWAAWTGLQSQAAAETQRQALKLLKQPDWHDFGPTFASQQLAKRHGIEVSDETVRKWMIEGGLWKSKSQRIQEVHVWRPRRSGFGELVQWDSSEHDWLEGRGPVRYLVRMIDDATSWSWGRFVEQDATPHTWVCCGSTWRKTDAWWMSTRIAIRCSQCHHDPERVGSTARSRPADPARAGATGTGNRFDFGLFAASERADRAQLSHRSGSFGEASAAGKVSTLEGANVFLEKEYWPEWNAHFARPVADFPNQHRALTPQLDLAAILCHVEERVVGNDYTFSFAGRRYQIARSQVRAGMRRQRLRVELRLDGELKARYQGRYLEIAECGARVVGAEPKAIKPVRKDHNAGGRSGWMQGFFDRPSPPLWKLLGD